MSALLKTCPFCGDDAELVELSGHEESFFYVHCQSCAAETEDHVSAASAVEHWNHRPGEDALCQQRDEWHRAAVCADYARRDFCAAVDRNVDEIEDTIVSLRARIDALDNLAVVARAVAVSALPSFSGGRPTVDNDAIVALRHAIADMEVHSAS